MVAPPVSVGTDDAEIRLSTVHDGQLFFPAYDGIHGTELWKYNSTHGVSMVADHMPDDDGLQPEYMVSHNGKLYFAGLFPNRGWELGSYSESEGIQWVTDITPWERNSEIASLCSGSV